MAQVQFCGDVQRSLRISNSKLATTLPAILRHESSSIAIGKSSSIQEQASYAANYQNTSMKVKSSSPAPNSLRKVSRDSFELVEVDKKILKKVAPIPLQVVQHTSVPWVVCRRVPVWSSLRDIQRFFTGLNILYVCVSTGEFGTVNAVNVVDIFVEFDRCAGAELAVLRSGEELRSEQNIVTINAATTASGISSENVAVPLQVEFTTEEDSVWAKHLGLVMTGSSTIRNRLQILGSLLPAKYLLLDVFKVSSQWSRITQSMTHFHRKSQAVGGKRKVQSGDGPEMVSTEANKNLRNRFKHLQGSFMSDELFLDDFIFAMEILPTAIVDGAAIINGSTTSSSNMTCPSLNFSRTTDTMLETVVTTLRDLITLQDSLRSISFEQWEPVKIVGNAETIGIDVSIDSIALAIDQLSRWIRIYKVILGELWSIRYTYSAGFSPEIVPSVEDKKKKKQKQLLNLK